MCVCCSTTDLSREWHCVMPNMMACKYVCAPLAGHKGIVKFILNFNLRRGEYFGLGLVVVFVAANLWLHKPPD
jgi:hypothetical protein